MNFDKRSILFSLLLAIAIIALGWSIYALAKPKERQPGDAFAKYELITKEMTESDVVNIMKAPAGDYSTGPIEFPFCGTGLPRELFRECKKGESSYFKTWTWDDGQVFVAFGKDGTTLSKSYTPVWPPEPLLDRCLRWLKLKRN
jgi:hypothetical protein